MKDVQRMYTQWMVIVGMLVNLMTGISVNAQDTMDTHQEAQAMTLNYYRQYGADTDPGIYAGLFTPLPTTLVELCRMIKAQLIHPIADLPQYRHQIPAERHNDDEHYPTVKTLLEGLMSYNPAGLILERPPEQRLIVSCRYHAILLAAILKYQGIPVRVRYGFAHYLAPGRHIYHVICEVWNSQEQRWMLVDPDRQKVDFPRRQFAFAGDVWLQYQHAAIDPSRYGVADWWGAHPILAVLCQDFMAVQGKEHPLYWEHPPIAEEVQMDVRAIPEERMAILNQIAIFLQQPDDHLHELQTLYTTYQFLHYQAEHNASDAN